MRLHLQIWRQENSSAPGRLVKYTLDDVSGDSSFLEMLDLLNEQLVGKGEVPVVFEHDCREGICGACGVMINGQAHGPSARTATKPDTHCDGTGRYDAARALDGQCLLA